MHSKIAQLRKDFHHKLSFKIANENQVIVVEKLLEKPAFYRLR
ncbi:transposase [Synechococcus sp. Nb3U1]|nr:transposase [Synechococcus sp. Nb3U1]MCF2969823.1 transposase [Synechococcus sp. Nb3U1]